MFCRNRSGGRIVQVRVLNVGVVTWLDALVGVPLLGASIWRGSVEVCVVESTGGEVSVVASISVEAELAPSSEAVMSCAVSTVAVVVSLDWG
jgi:hypothetical protein